MATEEELALIERVKEDPALGPLCQALGIVAEKEFGHVLRPRSEEHGWLGVGALMMLRLDPKIRRALNGNVLGWTIEADHVQKLIKEAGQ